MCDLIIREVDPSANAKTNPLSIEERNKIIQKMSEPNRSQLTKVNESLNGKVKFNKNKKRNISFSSIKKN